MPAKYLIVGKSADKKLSRVPLSLQKRVVKALEVIKQNPLSGIKLQGELSDYRKYRVGDYRIVYRFDAKESIAIVVKIEHRQGVYK